MEKALAKQGGGWPYVDAQMQHQLETGLCLPSAWSKWLKEGRLAESWNAYVAWKEAHPGEVPPPEIRSIPEPYFRPTIHRWGSESSWIEAQSNFPKEADTPFRQVYRFLLDAKIHRPGELLRAYGITPDMNHELSIILMRVNADKIAMQKRIADGDNELVHDLLRDPNAQPWKREEPLGIPEFVQANMAVFAKSKVGAA